MGKDLGASLPVDPINKIVNCEGAGFDKETCWNLESKTYQCPAGSHVYQYKVNGDGTYKLKSDFEYRANDRLVDLKTLWVGNLSNVFEIQGSCDGAPIRSTGVCGDGNIDGPEECEPRANPPRDRACTLEIDGEEVAGRQREECNPADCTWRELGGCSVLCGDGIRQVGEECDEGPLGGRIAGGGMSPENQYFCTRECEMMGGYCGDGGEPQVAYGERCDNGVSCTLRLPCASVDGCVCGSCIVPRGKKSCGNGSYGLSVSGEPWCKTDCSGFGPYCGDEVVNGAEQCDGDSITSKGICVPEGIPELNDVDTVLGSYTSCNNNEDCSDGTCVICDNSREG